MSTFTVVNTSNNQVKKINSDATTWGELKEVFEENGFPTTNINARLKESGLDLVSNDARLPEGDATIFLAAKDMKNGADYSELSYNKLRAMCSGLGINLGSSPTKTQLIESLEEHDEENEYEEEVSTVNPLVAKINEIIEVMNDELDTDIDALDEDADYSQMSEAVSNIETEKQRLLREARASFGR